MESFHRLPKAWRQFIAVVAAVVVLLLLSASFSSESHVAVDGIVHQLKRPVSQVRMRLWQKGRGAEATVKDAGNSTLGFSSIVYLNMNARFDRLDALSLQAFLSGIDITLYPAVEKEELFPAGLPPTKNPDFWNLGRIACWRAHANIWARMIRENLPPTLILESDATWDINIRKIMPEINLNLRKLLHDINSTALLNPKWTYDNSSSTNNPDDVWQSRHWDLLSVGHCMADAPDDKNLSVTYYDPFVAKNGETPSPGGQRAIHRSNGIVCTAGYAITQTGAAKLLLRSATNFDSPVDLLMSGMISRGELVAYHIDPPPVAQWKYRSGLNMTNRGSQSDIDKRDDEFDENAWDEVEKTGNVWETWHLQGDWRFNSSALRMAGHLLLDKDLPAE